MGSLKARPIFQRLKQLEKYPRQGTGRAFSAFSMNNMRSGNTCTRRLEQQARHSVTAYVQSHPCILWGLSQSLSIKISFHSTFLLMNNYKLFLLHGINCEAPWVSQRIFPSLPSIQGSASFHSSSNHMSTF